MKKKKLEKILEALKSAKLVHEVMHDNPPWAGNEVMEGCIDGCWIGTVTKIDKAIKIIEEELES